MKVLNIRTANSQTHFANFNKFWDQRYLLLLFLIATYITFELFYNIKDNLNVIYRETSRHKPSDRKLTTIPYITTNTQNPYYHHHHNDHHRYKTLNDSQLNFKFCANEDKSQLLNRIIVLPHIISVNNGNNNSFPFYSCDLIRKFGNHSNPIINNNINGTSQENEINLNEFDNKLLKKLFPNVRFITQHEFQIWSKSRIHKPKIIHEFISVGNRKFQNIEILSHHHYDPYIRTSSFSSRKSVKETTKFLLKELKNDVEVLLVAHDLKFRKFYKVFSSIYNS
ncbi:11706_t:CDS:2, partial [Diversispora eburnea]